MSDIELDPDHPGEFHLQILPLVEMLFATLNLYRGLTKDSFRYEVTRPLPEAAYVSKAALTGSIFQIGYYTIKQCGDSIRQRDLPSDIALPKSSKIFCCGSVKYGVPVGLIIYAARNIWAHYDEKRALRPATTSILRKLMKERGRSFGVEDLNDPGLDPTSDHWSLLPNLLNILEWESARDYDLAMRECFLFQLD